jgi:hypothetical protein
LIYFNLSYSFFFVDFIWVGLQVDADGWWIATPDANVQEMNIRPSASPGLKPPGPEFASSPQRGARGTPRRLSNVGEGDEGSPPLDNARMLKELRTQVSSLEARLSESTSEVRI